MMHSLILLFGIFFHSYIAIAAGEASACSDPHTNVAAIQNSVEAGTLLIGYLYDPTRNGMLFLPDQPVRTKFRIVKQVGSTTVEIQPATLERITAESMDLADTLSTVLKLTTTCTEGSTTIGSGQWRVLVSAHGPFKGRRQNDAEDLKPIPETANQVVPSIGTQLERRSSDRLRLVPGTKYVKFWQWRLQTVSQVFGANRSVALWSSEGRDEQFAVQDFARTVVSAITQVQANTNDLYVAPSGSPYRVTLKLTGFQSWESMISFTSHNIVEFRALMSNLLVTGMHDIANLNTVTGAYEWSIRDADTNNPFGQSVVMVISREVYSPYSEAIQTYQNLIYRWKSQGVCVEDTTSTTVPNKRNIEGETEGASIDAKINAVAVSSMNIATVLDRFVYQPRYNPSQLQMVQIWDDIIGNKIGLTPDVFKMYKAQNPMVDSIESINNLLCLGPLAAPLVTQRQQTTTQLCNIQSHGTHVETKRKFLDNSNPSDVMDAHNHKPTSAHLLQQIAEGNLRFEYYTFYRDGPTGLGMEVVYLLGREPHHLIRSLQDGPTSRFAVIHYHITRSVDGGLAVSSFNVRHADDLRATGRINPNRVMAGNRRAHSTTERGTVMLDCNTDDSILPQNWRFWVPIFATVTQDSHLNAYSLLINRAHNAMNHEYRGEGIPGLFSDVRASNFWRGDGVTGWTRSGRQSQSFNGDGGAYYPSQDLLNTPGFVNYNAQ